MGVDGYITISKIERGLEQLELPECGEVFRVRDPVILVPYYLRDFGKRVKSAYCADEDLQHMLLYDPNPDVVAVVLSGLEWGVAVIPMSNIEPAKHEKWKREDGPGGIPISEIAPYWSAVTPGYWIVTRAYRSGMGDDTSEFFSSDIRQEKGIVFGRELDIRLFT